MKTCSKCEKQLPATPEYFNRSKKGDKFGLRATCKMCQRAEGKEYYEKTKDPLKRDEILGDTKICITCGVEYPRTLQYYAERTGSRDRLRNNCRECASKKRKQYHEINREKILDTVREYHRNNKEILSLKAKERYQKNKERIKQYRKGYAKDNQEKIVEGRKRSYQKYKEKVCQKRKEYYEENKEVILEKDKVYKLKHKDRYRRNQKEWKRRKYATDLKFNLNEKMSTGIYISLREGKAGKHWEQLVNYTLEQLIKHIEALFTERMTWERLLNGEIHIDHIRPKASFNFETHDDPEFMKCWALSNLQPLWAKENIRKRDKWEYEIQEAPL